MNSIEDRDRITARVPQSVALKLQEAADLTGATLNQFLIQAALEKAEKIIDREKTISYTANDAAMLLNMLDNPPSPNAALKKAFERFKNRENNGAPDNVSESET
jgi:uncharacterized protein (DUF1778 family)